MELDFFSKAQMNTMGFSNEFDEQEEQIEEVKTKKDDSRSF